MKKDNLHYILFIAHLSYPVTQQREDDVLRKICSHILEPMDYQKDLWKYFTILVQKQLTGRGTCILKKVISTLRVEDTHTGTFCWSTNVTATACSWHPAEF